MTPRAHALLALAVPLLAACNLTLAQDIAPPPGYVPPTPAPTLGPLIPPAPADIASGAAIFAEKCAPCHGTTGLGDGEQGKQLPVSVAALALPETARPASPARWFTVVTQGNLDRFMPPFASLTEQERWDVVNFAQTLHTTPEQVERGRALFEEACSDCPTDAFQDETRMAGLSDLDLAKEVREGNGSLPVFGAALDDDAIWAVVAYLRTLSFKPVTQVAASEDATAATEAAGGLTTEGTQVPVPAAVTTAATGLGVVRGQIDNQTGATLPENLALVLHAYEHEEDRSSGPQEVLSTEGTVAADGTYTFDGMELKESRIYMAEVVVDGLAYRSEFVVVSAGALELSLPPLTIYGTTVDTGNLGADSLQVFFDYANEDSVQLFYVYRLLNTGRETIRVEVGQNQDVPFISFPPGAQSLGYEETNDSAGLLAMEGGFAMPPSESTYGLIAFGSLPKARSLTVSQPALIPIDLVTLYLPQGVKASGASLIDQGPQEIQGTVFNVYTTGSIPAGGTLAFELSGVPTEAPPGSDFLQNRELIIGAGALGAALILAGAWLYLRERSKASDDEAEAGDLENPEDIMDAIIALDDLHRAGKIPDEVYQNRRTELKSKLKEEL